jgi:uncharacterized protein YndB with AHSA1/START domain
MTRSPEPTVDPELDLVLERTVEDGIEFGIRAWTEPELLKRWFCPKPWTTPGFRPVDIERAVPVFTCILTFEKSGKGTRYRAHVMHRDAAAKSVHESMGFHAGWGAALDQLVEMFRQQ